MRLFAARLRPVRTSGRGRRSPTVLHRPDPESLAGPPWLSRALPTPLSRPRVVALSRPRVVGPRSSPPPLSDPESLVQAPSLSRPRVVALARPGVVGPRLRSPAPAGPRPGAIEGGARESEPRSAPGMDGRRVVSLRAGAGGHSAVQFGARVGGAMAAQGPFKPEVVGSSPTRPTPPSEASLRALHRRSGASAVRTALRPAPAAPRRLGASGPLGPARADDASDVAPRGGYSFSDSTTRETPGSRTFWIVVIAPVGSMPKTSTPPLAPFADPESLMK